MDEPLQGALSQSPAEHRMAGALGALWGVGGVLYLLTEATWRLAMIALDGLSNMPAIYWLPTLAWVGFNAYAEGYKGFQRAFAPRLVARAELLVRKPTPTRTLLAPLFLMALVDATRKRLIVSWVLVGAITGLVTIVRALPQPARGIVDAGVVVGLGWGIAAIVAMLVRRAQGHVSDTDPELA